MLICNGEVLSRFDFFDIFSTKIFNAHDLCRGKHRGSENVLKWLWNNGIRKFSN